MLGFAIAYLMQLCTELKDRDESNPKYAKMKELGSYSESDPMRDYALTDSVYSLAFVINMKHDTLRSFKEKDEDLIPQEALPSKLTVFEVNLTAMMCAFFQSFTSILLLNDFLHTNQSSEDSQSYQASTLEANPIIIIKFICALLFHFGFETEIRNGLKMMKYVLLHYDQFTNPGISFLIGFLRSTMIILVEFINLWNLSNITEGVKDLMFDFIALGIIAEFDDYFIQLYSNSTLTPMIGMNLKFQNVYTPKREGQTIEEKSRYKIMEKVKKYLEELQKILKQKNRPSAV